MKKYLSIIIISLITFSAKAQNFSGKAIYKSYRKSNFKISDDSKMTEKQKEAIEEFENLGGTSKAHSPKSQGFFGKIKEAWEDLK